MIQVFGDASIIVAIPVSIQDNDEMCSCPEMQEQTQRTTSAAMSDHFGAQATGERHADAGGHE